MKKIQLIFITFCSLFTFAQPEVIIPIDGCPINTISTNPYDYQNSSDPLELQKWDWMAENYTVYISGNLGTTGIPVPIVSPFFDQSGNINTFDMAYPIIKDFKTENGWELLYRNFGTENQGIATPYFLLYNRYSGIIRAFANIINSGDFPYNAAKLELSFAGNESKQTALLNQLGSHTFSFMDFQADASHFAANSYTNSGVNNNYFWVWADFNTLYDPCTCGFGSRMVFNVGLINNIDISMTAFMRQITMVDAIDDNSTNVNNDFFGKVQKYLQFGSGIISGAGEVMESGNKGYEAGTKLISEAQKNVATLAPMIGRTRAANISRSIGKILFEIPKVNQMFNLASTLITVVKKLAGQAENLNDNGSVENLGSTVVTEVKTSIDLSGEIEVNGGHINTFLVTPGAQIDQTNFFNLKPVYNNILGVVTLAEQPEFDLIRYTNSGPLGNRYLIRHEYDDFYQEYRDDYVFFPTISQLKVKKTPKIIVNPASGLKIKEVEYQIVFENIEHGDNYHIENSEFQGLIIPGQFKYFMDFGEPEYFFPKSGTDREDLMRSFGYDLNILDPTNENSKNWNNAIFSTPYLNQECFKKTGLFSFSEYNKPQVRLKVILVPIVPNEKIVEVINILSFPSYINEISGGAYYINGTGNNLFIDLPIDESEFIFGKKVDVILQNEIIESNLEVLGDLTIGENVSIKPGVTTISASGNIYYDKTIAFIPDINGNIISSNYNINFIAGKEIITSPESVILPEIDLLINPNLKMPCENIPDVQATVTEIANSCNSIKYRELISRGLKFAKSDSLNQINQYLASSKKPFDFTLYPNPAKSSTRIVLENYDSRTTTFILTDVMGKNVEIKPNSISHNTVSLDVSTLEKGIYFVTVRSDFQEKTKQLIID